MSASTPVSTAMRAGGAAMAALLALNAAAAESANVTAPANGHSFYGDPAVPDISGLWLGSYSAAPGEQPQFRIEDRDFARWAPWPPPLTAKYRQQADERVAAARQGRALGDLGVRCYPLGLVRAITSKLYPDEIIQTPGAVTLLIFARGSIVIWTDGRPHPSPLVPSYKGHSIGYWQGDTLQVDTVGIIGSDVDASTRTPHSGKAHMQWSIRRVAPDRLHVHVLLEDQDAFTEPLVETNIWRAMSGPRWEVLDDQSCFENNREATGATGVPGFSTF